MKEFEQKRPRHGQVKEVMLKGRAVEWNSEKSVSMKLAGTMGTLQKPIFFTTFHLTTGSTANSASVFEHSSDNGKSPGRESLSNTHAPTKAQTDHLPSETTLTFAACHQHLVRPHHPSNNLWLHMFVFIFPHNYCYSPTV